MRLRLRMEREALKDASGYARDLITIIDDVEALWLPDLYDVVGRSDLRTDALDGADWDRLRRRLEESLTVALGSSALAVSTRRRGQRGAARATQLSAAMLRIDPSQLGIASDALATQWVQINDRLTRDVASTYAEGVRSVLAETNAGDRSETLIQRMMDRADVTRSRARLIAVDQMLTLYSDVNQRRQREVGVEEYEWSTSNDERVRSNHATLNRQVYSWDAPPIGGGTSGGDSGHPGSGIRCRCIAIPYRRDV